MYQYQASLHGLQGESKFVTAPANLQIVSRNDGYFEPLRKTY